MDNLKNEICKAFNTTLDTIVKHSYRGGPTFTVDLVLNRIFTPTYVSIDLVFPEIKSRGTITKMLQNVFPGKLSRSQQWNTYVLEKISMRKCSNCSSILLHQDFCGKNSVCRNCAYNMTKEWKLSNPDKVIATNKEWRVNNLDKQYASNKEWKLKNPDKVLDNSKEYYHSHKAESKARGIKRKTYIQGATPEWANLELMNKIYNAREEGEHIDHIVPLQHPLVCGLHNEFNLQYLSSQENLSKGNKFDLETYVHELP